MARQKTRQVEEAAAQTAAAPLSLTTAQIEEADYYSAAERAMRMAREEPGTSPATEHGNEPKGS